MLKHATLAAGVFALLFGVIDQASAHAKLKTAQPAADSTVAASPGAITLEFSEGVVPKFSSIALAGEGGKPVKIGKAAKGGSAESLVAQIEGSLPPGTYTVTWRAVSVDSHKTQGSFRFTIKP